MIGLIQRVSEAKVEVEGQTIAQIEPGILLFLGIEKGDNEQSANKLLDKIIRYRIFSDDSGRMNLSLLDTNKELLIVSQFTLAADTQKGTRAGFSKAEDPKKAQVLYDYFVNQAHTNVPTQSGQFAANMQVSLTNDGPVTFWIKV